jgi:hypothetical protein
MAHSPYTARAVEFVKKNPGCSKWELAKHLTYSCLRCPSKQYYLVNTQIRLGNIDAYRNGNRYELYVEE